jgi:hypothetical protein
MKREIMKFVKIYILLIIILFSAGVHAQKIYWVDGTEGKLYSADKDGNNKTALVSGLGCGFGLDVDLTNNKIYWVDNSAKAIKRCNIDGTGVEVIVTQESGSISIPRGLALNVPGNKIYWSDNGSGKIMSANLSGSGIAEIKSGLDSPGFISFDMNTQKIYWADNGINAKKIQRCNVNGDSLQDVVSNLSQVWGIALDVLDKKIYWIDSGIDKLQYGSLDTIPVIKRDAISGLTGFQRGIVIDKHEGFMYWSSNYSVIERAAINGTGELSIISGLAGTQGVAINWDSGLPVELTSFASTVKNNSVLLNWQTATEKSNYGFEVERSADKVKWQKIAFVNGNGNSNSEKYYSYADKSSMSGKQYYRLKQVDTDGNYEYSKTIEADLGLPKSYELSQNYPNPFNPATTIKFALPESQVVKITVFNSIGEQVTKVVDEYMEAGSHEVNFSASNLASGVYLYRLEAGKYVQTKKMMLIK